MNAIELLDIINTGETSLVQFKEKISSPDNLAAEMVAMSNSLGGLILVGVKDKTGEIVGMDYDQVQKTASLAGNVASYNIIPPIFITTEVVKLDKNDEKTNILIIHIKEGINKPYKDNNLIVWVKQASDKRRVSDNAELLRLFQRGTHLLADEMEVYDTVIDDIDKNKFEDFFQKDVKKTIEATGLTYEQALRAKRVLRNDRLTLGGLLFFGKNPQEFKPAFCVKSVYFFGNTIGGKDYRSKPENIYGTIPDLFNKGMDFFTSNLRFLQKNSGFNKTGALEISEIALEEVIQNALVHRDYFKNAPIRLMIFDNRIEIVSPGRLPNTLTVEEIKYGNPVTRNNLLVAYSLETMPFSGLGTGIKRALSEQPDIEFINDVEGEQFVVKIPRPETDN